MRSLTSQQSTDLRGTEKPEKSVYRSLKQVNKEKGGLWSVSLNDKFEMKITKRYGYCYGVRTGVLCRGPQCHPQLHGLWPFAHCCAAKSVLLTAVQPAMQLPQELFSLLFLVPSCGKFLNSCSQTQNPPSCGASNGREQHSTASASYVRAP